VQGADFHLKRCEVIKIKKVQPVVALIMIAVSMLVLLFLFRASDKDLIVQLMHKYRFGDYELPLPKQFLMEEPFDLFREYGARYYRCTWLGAKHDGETINVTADILIKNGEALPVGPPEMASDLREVDFDHDGVKELIFYTSWGSGLSYNNYFVFEKGNEPIYMVACMSARFGKIQDDDYLIHVLFNLDRELFGVLKYRIVDGVKSVYIDAGKYTDALEQTSYQSPFSVGTKN
jgi:hypothetical protein